MNDDYLTHRAHAILKLIRSYHDFEGCDGDSIVFFHEKEQMIKVKNLILNEIPRSYRWTLCKDEDEIMLFSDQCNDNCILTIDKKHFMSSPDWMGLRIEI